MGCRTAAYPQCDGTAAAQGTRSGPGDDQYAGNRLYMLMKNPKWRSPLKNQERDSSSNSSVRNPTATAGGLAKGLAQRKFLSSKHSLECSSGAGYKNDFAPPYRKPLPVAPEQTIPMQWYLCLHCPCEGSFHPGLTWREEILSDAYSSRR